MNLGQLIDFVGNLLDYDPTNDTYRSQLVSILNDAQARILTDRPWDFAIRDRKLKVFTDTTFDFTFTNGSDQLAGVAIPVSTDQVLPGSDFALAEVRVTDSNGATFTHTLMWVKNATTAFLDRPFVGVTGTYTAGIRRRDIYLPSDCLQVQNVSDPSVGIPAKALFLSQWELEDTNLDPDLLGTIEAYLPTSGKVIRAPNTARGISVVAGVAQGARTVNVYMVNVQGPAATNFEVYPKDASDGWESAFSKVATYSLTDTETLSFQPEPLDPQTGLWRRYYFTCPEAGILARFASATWNRPSLRESPPGRTPYRRTTRPWVGWSSSRTCPSRTCPPKASRPRPSATAGTRAQPTRASACTPTSRGTRT